MKLENLKKGLFGYQKASVYVCIAAIEEEFSNKLMEKEAQAKKEGEQYQIRIQQLEKELKNVILSLLNDMLQYGNKKGSKIVNVGPYKFILGVTCNFSIKNALGIKEAKNYFAIVTNRRFELIPYTRKSLIEHCVKPVRSYSYGFVKAVYIEALSVDREKLKALDIEDNNTVRLIYGSDRTGYRTEECNKYKV